jgi:hypothetical protein
MEKHVTDYLKKKFFLFHFLFIGLFIFIFFDPSATICYFVRKIFELHLKTAKLLLTDNYYSFIFHISYFCPFQFVQTKKNIQTFYVWKLQTNTWVSTT